MIDTLPTPDWQSDDGSVALYCADCLTILPQLADGCVDAVVTDPPYGIGEHGGRFRDRKGGGHRVLPNLGWDNSRPTADAFDGILRVSHHQAVWGGNYFADMLPVSRGWLYWDKKMGGDFSDGELAWTSRDAVLKSFSYCNKRHGKVHPTQKPLPLIEWCLSFFPTAETILDPFMGSGSTGVACVKTGRQFIGIEMERKYFDIAVRRIQEAFADHALFATEATNGR